MEKVSCIYWSGAMCIFHVALPKWPLSLLFQYIYCLCKDEDDMYNIHVFNKNKKISPRALPDRSAMVGHRGRSRSLGKWYRVFHS